jgi:hypothetical protein
VKNRQGKVLLSEAGWQQNANRKVLFLLYLSVSLNLLLVHQTALIFAQLWKSRLHWNRALKKSAEK